MPPPPIWKPFWGATFPILVSSSVTAFPFVSGSPKEFIAAILGWGNSSGATNCKTVVRVVGGGMVVVVTIGNGGGGGGGGNVVVSAAGGVGWVGVGSVLVLAAINASLSV